MVDLTIRCFTRQQLAEYSTFTLPVAARADMGRRPLRVPPLTLERIRTLERHGVFDAFQIRLVSPDRVPARERERYARMFQWPPKPIAEAEAEIAQWAVTFGGVFPVAQWQPRRQGDTRLYRGLDLLVARLAAWMLHRGFPMPQLPLLLRGDVPLLPALTSGTAHAVVVFQYSDRHARRAFVAGAADVGEHVAAFEAMRPHGAECWVFPLTWLGRSGFLPKVRKAMTTPVQRWRQEWTPRELSMRQHRETVGRPSVDGPSPRARGGTELRT